MAVLEFPNYGQLCMEEGRRKAEWKPIHFVCMEMKGKFVYAIADTGVELDEWLASKVEEEK